MQWKVVESVICPHTGLVFTYISGVRNVKLTIWYEGEIFMPPGSNIKTYRDGILINDKFLPITVYNITPYNEKLWESLKSKASCPANTTDNPDSCEFPFSCNVKNCPYGLTNIP